MKFKLKKDKLIVQKRVYLALIILMALFIVIGMIFPLCLDKDNSDILTSSITTFFSNIKNNNIDYSNGFINTFITNSCYVIGVWLLGISIIGSVFVIINFIYQSFSFGFSIVSIIKVYGFKGVVGSITYIFPGEILSLILTLLLTYYSLSFSVKLFRYLFLKENLNFKLIMNKYIKILIICFVGYLFITLLNTYFAPMLMKLFTILIK